jgi:hypothetical protein
MQKPPIRTAYVLKVNVVLCKVPCRNHCCLVNAFFELGTGFSFWHIESVA